MSRTAAARAALYPFLAVVIMCGLFSVEAWPFTAWKLFSRVRGPQESGWLATALSPDGAESRIDFAELGRGYTGALHVMIDLPRRTEAERLAVCSTWLRAVRAGDETITGVRVYRTRSTVPRTDATSPPAQRTLYFEC